MNDLTGCDEFHLAHPSIPSLTGGEAPLLGFSWRRGQGVVALVFTVLSASADFVSFPSTCPNRVGGRGEKKKEVAAESNSFLLDIKHNREYLTFFLFEKKERKKTFAR
jgi:hypothetical protein